MNKRKLLLGCKVVQKKAEQHKTAKGSCGVIPSKKQTPTKRNANEESCRMKAGAKQECGESP